MSQRWRKKGAALKGDLVLGLECGGEHVSVALLRLHETDDEGPWTIESMTTLRRGHRHADAVLTLANEAVAGSGTTADQLRLIAVSHGPGGFTGVRVGLATAEGLATGLNIPVFTVGSLDAMAMHAAPAEGVVVPMFDARRGEVYAAAFDVSNHHEPKALTPPLLGTGEEVLAEIAAQGVAKPRHIFGTGAQVMDVATVVPDHWHTPQAVHIAALAAYRWVRAGRPTSNPPLDACYVRKSDAEIDEERRAAQRSQKPN